MVSFSFDFMGYPLLLGQVDGLSMPFVVAFSVIIVPALWYSFAYHRHRNQSIVSVLFFLCSLGTVTAGDLLSFLVFWEGMMILSAILIAVDIGRRDLRIGYRYLVVHVIAGASLFLGVIIQVSSTNSLDLAGLVPAALPFLILAGVIKAALIPFHFWVPDAYGQISPGIAVILTAFTTKVGVYAIARFFPSLSGLALLGATVAVFAVVMALGQRHLRRVLSYHLIGQIGYMVAGIGALSDIGVAAASLHMFSGVMYKGLLFMVAGSVLYQMKTDDVGHMGGLIRKMPLTFVAALVGAASISGLPPFNGYISKTALKIALQGDPVISLLLTVAAVLTAMSFAKLLWDIFLREKPQCEGGEARESPAVLLIPMLVLAGICLGTGIHYPLLTDALVEISIPPIYSVGSLWESLYPVLLGVVLVPITAIKLRHLARRGLHDLDFVFPRLIEGFTQVGRVTRNTLEGHLQTQLLIVTAFLVFLIWMWP